MEKIGIIRMIIFNITVDCSYMVHSCFKHMHKTSRNSPSFSLFILLNKINK